MKGPKPRICVVGSLVMDLVFRVKHRPGPGETILGEEFGMFLGGKGFNQAIAARRLGADVVMAGRVGRDAFGDLFLAKLREEGIPTDFVRRDDEAGTGVACPTIDESGQNSIVVVRRANMRVTPEDVDLVAGEIARADVLMLQFEIPQAASVHAAGIARKNETLVMLDPAPVGHGRPDEVRMQSADCGMQSGRLLDNLIVDYIVPNEIEAHMLTGRMTPEECAAVLLPEVRNAVVISLGQEGALVVDRGHMKRFPARSVEAKDTTGAGDAFRAGLAVTLAQGWTIDEAARFANACGALACTVLGAEPSMPRRDAVERLLAERR